MKRGQKITNPKNMHQNTVSKILLALVIFLSEILIIFIFRKLEMQDIFLAGFAIFSLNLAFIAFYFRQKATQNMLFEAQQNAISEQNRILTITNSLTDGILSVDSNGKIELYNSAAQDILNFPKKLTAQNLFEIAKIKKITGEDFDFREIFRKGEKFFSTNDLTFFERNDKNRIQIEILRIHDFKKIKAKDENFVVIFRDITKQKTLDEERDEFISVVSHELRTPIAITEGAISNLRLMIERKMPYQTLSKNAQITYVQIAYLANMINDLSTLSKAERGLGDKFEIINPKILGEELFNKYQKSAIEKGLILKFHADSNLPEIKSSRLYLEELLQNIITNALKYTKKGEVSILITNSGKNVKFAIKDTGIGIAKIEQKKIFEKFYRSEDYRTRETGGTGLGLYIAEKLASKLGTKINLKSRQNYGSTFSFEIPGYKNQTDNLL